MSQRVEQFSSLDHHLPSVTRRRFLKGAVLFAALLTLPGCEQTNPVKILPEVSLPQETMNSLYATIEPLQQTIPENERASITVRTSLGVDTVNGTSTDRGVEITLAEDKNNPPNPLFVPPLQILELVSWHEMVHCIDPRLKGQHPELPIDHFGPPVWDEESRNAFREGTYVQNVYDGDYRDLGNSYENLDEYYASVLNVMHFFPEQFLQNVRNIVDPFYKNRLIQYALECIDSVVERSTQKVTRVTLGYEHIYQGLQGLKQGTSINR